MRKDSLARIYAQALFQVAQREDQVAPWAEQLLRLQRVVTGSRSLQIFLSSPKIPAPARRKMICEISSLEGLAPEMDNFFRLIVRKREIKLLGRIGAIYNDLADNLFGRINVSVESAVPLEREEKVRLRRILSSGWEKTIKIDYKPRPDLIAGLVIKAGERIYDLSLRGQLNRLKAQLLS